MYIVTNARRAEAYSILSHYAGDMDCECYENNEMTGEA
jgi:hypothetical protein